MRISKSMINVLIQIVNGADNLPELALKTGLSRNRCSELSIQLEKAHFLVRERPGMKRKLRLSDSLIATSFREMYLTKTYMKYLEFFYGAKLDLLQLLIYEPKSVEVLSKITKTRKRAVRRNLRDLRYSNLIWRNRSMYSFAGKGHPLIYNFLNALRTFTHENKIVLWKFNEEELFRTRNKKLIKGYLTGLNAYGNYGVLVRTTDYFCSIPKKRLTKKEIFIHSLLEIGNEPRILGLAIAFYLKNNLFKEKLDFLISKYDLDEIFKEFKRTIKEFKNTENIRVNNSRIPSITRGEIQEVLRLYGVKNV